MKIELVTQLAWHFPPLLIDLTARFSLVLLFLRIYDQWEKYALFFQQNRNIMPQVSSERDRNLAEEEG
jgi:hypothetical protein